jgi:ABC-type branched-subunit amino acid transport system substrate-binding protein
LSSTVLIGKAVRLMLAVLTGVTMVVCSNSVPAAAASGSRTAGSFQSGSTPYAVGIMGDLTGASAFAGVAYRDGALSYIKWVNDHGGVNGHQLVPQVVDHVDRADQGIAGVTKLVQQDGVLGIIDGGSTAEVGALSAALNQNQVPLVSWACVPPDQVFAPMVTKYCFLAGTDSTSMATGQVNFALQLKPNAMIALIPSDNPYGQTWTQKATDMIAKGGGTVVSNVAIPLVGTDMSAAVNAVAQSNPDVVVAILGDTQAVTFERGLTQAGIDQTPVVNYNGGVGLTTFQSINNPNYYGVKFDEFPDAATTQGTSDFNAAASAAGFDPNTPLLWHGYFAAATLVGALHACPDNCTRQQLAMLMNNITIPMNSLVPEPYTFTPDRHMGLTKSGVYQLTTGETGIPSQIATVPLQ